MARYYARAWIAGKNVTWCNPDGSTRPYCNVHSFPSRRERDVWVAGGASFRTEKDFREPCSSGWWYLRSLLRREAAEPCAEGTLVKRSEDPELY